MTRAACNRSPADPLLHHVYHESFARERSVPRPHLTGFVKQGQRLIQARLLTAAAENVSRNFARRLHNACVVLVDLALDAVLLPEQAQRARAVALLQRHARLLEDPSNPGQQLPEQWNAHAAVPDEVRPAGLPATKLLPSSARILLSAGV